MKVLLFGASGMVGQGVLRECLLDPRVEIVAMLVRNAMGQHHPKLREIVLPDIMTIETIANELSGYDACLFCIGVTSAGMSEPAYTKAIYDLTLKVATLLARVNLAMIFVYVSGQGTDSSEKGRLMWARVKGRTENALLRLPFKAAYMLRPGAIQPLYGIQSKTGWYRALYAITGPIYPLLKRLIPHSITTTEQMGRAMIEVAANGHRKPILETRDINAIR